MKILNELNLWHVEVAPGQFYRDKGGCWAFVSLLSLEEYTMYVRSGGTSPYFEFDDLPEEQKDIVVGVTRTYESTDDGPRGNPVWLAKSSWT